jgi:hypothetical protein
MNGVKEVTEAVERMTGTIVRSATEEVQKRFAKMFAAKRAELNDSIREMIDFIQENGEDTSVDYLKEKLVELRAELVDLQEGVDESAGVWSDEIRNDVMKVIAERLASRPSEPIDVSGN